jgi:hypothetical protein
MVLNLYSYFLRQSDDGLFIRILAIDALERDLDFSHHYVVCFVRISIGSVDKFIHAIDILPENVLI